MLEGFMFGVIGMLVLIGIGKIGEIIKEREKG